MVKCTLARVTVTVMLQQPQPEPASPLKSATRDASFLRSDSRCQQYVIGLSNFTPRYLGSKQKGFVVEVDFQLKLTFVVEVSRQGFVVEIDFQLTRSFLVKVQDCRQSLCSVEL